MLPVGGNLMNGAPLFQEPELDDAKKRLRTWAPHETSRVVWFYNSLQVFLRDVERRRGSQTPIRLLACDASEIVSYVSPSERSARAFSFGGLIAEASSDQKSLRERETALRNLDRLVIHHLLFDRKMGHVILDPHLEEVLIVERAKKLVQEELELKFEPYLEQGDINSLTITQLQRIRKWIDSTDLQKQPSEFTRFRDTFLPGWRSELAKSLADVVGQRDKVRKYLNNSRHFLLAPEYAGRKSIFGQLNELGQNLKWADFVKYTEDPLQKKRFDEITNCVIDLAEILPRPNRGRRHLDEATRRDAQSIGILHVLNSFLSQEIGDSSRVELVTRSQMIHMIISALPEGRLLVSVRHPLLIPEIYDFDHNAIQALGGVFQSVDGAISPILDAVSDNDESAGAVSAATDAQIHTPIAELVNLLSDNIAIQQTLERSQEHVDTIAGLVFKSRNSPDHRRGAEMNLSTAEVAFSQEIKLVFDLLSRKLREREDPFSLEAILSIALNNRNLIESERRRIRDRVSRVRVLRIETETFGSYPPFIAARLMNGRMPRLFHFYSKRMKSVLWKDGTERVSQHSYVEAELDNQELFQLAKKAIEDIESIILEGKSVRKDEVRNDLLYNIEVTLLCCIIFSSGGRYQAAASLASSVLSNISNGIRGNESGAGLAEGFWIASGKNDYRVPLACKELFLLRHYCERAVSFNQIRAGKQTLRSVKGDAVRNLARAQRDLDLAVLMNEEAEHLLRSGLTDAIGEASSSPEGASLLKDYRFSLVHFSAWLDQYLSILKRTARNSVWRGIDLQSEETASLRDRFDLWTAAGLIKETEMLASSARSASAKAKSVDLKRYLKHVEVRAYQNMLTAFLAFLAFDVAPDIQSFWNHNLRPARDRLFVFRDWETWFKNYVSLMDEYGFDLKFAPVVSVVLGGLIELQELKRSDDHSLFAGRIVRLRQQLEGLARDPGRPQGNFSDEIVDVLIERLQDLG